MSDQQDRLAALDHEGGWTASCTLRTSRGEEPWTEIAWRDCLNVDRHRRFGKWMAEAGVTTPPAEPRAEELREALTDYDAALRSLVGDHLVHPAHIPDCAVCIALNGRTKEQGASRRAALAERLAGVTDPEHVIESMGCWCGPYRDPIDPEVIIHRRPVKS